jgi:large subunit ribosomal protein L25
MKTSFELTAEFRETHGKGASRRLRHDGKVPAILYGGHLEARALDLEPSEARDHARQRALLLDHPESEGRQRDAGCDPEGRAAASVQECHPARRLSARRGERKDPHCHSAALQGRGGFARREVPGRLVSHMRTEIEVSCLPKDLPEFIEVDLSGLSLNESIHLSQLKIPGGRAARRSRQGRFRGGRDPQPACRGARADGGRSSGRRSACGRRGRSGGGGTRGGGGGRCSQGGGTREGGSQEGTGEERREEIIDASERGAARTRRPFHFFSVSHARFAT